MGKGPAFVVEEGGVCVRVDQQADKLDSVVVDCKGGGGGWGGAGMMGG